LASYSSQEIHLKNAIDQRGTGKSHVMAALGRALVEHGHPVLFTSVASLVERLLDAKRNLKFARELKRLDNFEASDLKKSIDSSAQTI
jgi:hypothetical protein